MKDKELHFGFYFFCLSNSFQILMVPFFHLAAQGGSGESLLK